MDPPGVGLAPTAPVVRPGLGAGYAQRMDETPSAEPEEERRCQSCGALLYEGAAWCGMCFAPVQARTETGTETETGSDTETESRPDTHGDAAPGAGPGVPAAVEEAHASSGDRVTAVADATTTPLWPCPLCGGRNSMDLDLCATCGTPFAALMREERIRPDVEPSAAFRRSLVFPGLGHRLVGRTLDGFARGVLFGMLLIATLVLGVSGVSSGLVHSLFLVYASATVGVYIVTALEATRLARGEDLMLPSRTLLWLAVTILLLSIVIVSFAIATSGRR